QHAITALASGRGGGRRRWLTAGGGSGSPCRGWLLGDSSGWSTARVFLSRRSAGPARRALFHLIGEDDLLLGQAAAVDHRRATLRLGQRQIHRAIVGRQALVCRQPLSGCGEVDVAGILPGWTRDRALRRIEVHPTQRRVRAEVDVRRLEELVATLGRIHL